MSTNLPSSSKFNEPPQNNKLLSAHSRSAAPLAQRGDLGQYADLPPRHRRSPTAPSAAISSAAAAAAAAAANAVAGNGDGNGEWRDNKENRYDYRDRDQEHEAGPSHPVPAPRPSADKLRLERERAEYLRQKESQRERDRERDRERELEEEMAARDREREEDRILAERREREEREMARQRRQEARAQETVRPGFAQQPHADRVAPAPPGNSRERERERDRERDREREGKRFIEVRYEMEVFLSLILNLIGILTQVRKKRYQRLDCIGRGGTSRVYRVLEESTQRIFALKRVNLEQADPETIKGYQNEIQLLGRLADKSGIIRLYDHESNVRKNYISLVSLCTTRRFVYDPRTPF